MLLFSLINFKFCAVKKDYKFNSIEVLICKSFIDSYLGQDEIVSINNGWRECNKMKKEIQNPENSLEYNI